MQTISLYIHILGALLLVGGMLFFSLIAAPYLRTLEDKRDMAIHFQGLARRFKTFGLIAWSMLLITGPLNLFSMGMDSSIFLSTEFWSSSYGATLMIKLSLIAILITSSVVHDFFIGPKSRDSEKFSLLAKLMGRGNLVIALFIVFFAVLLRLNM